MTQNKESTLATLWRFIRPEPEELVFYLLAIFSMLGLAAYRVMVQGQVGKDSYGLFASFSSARDTLFGFFNDNDSWGRFFLFGLWFLIGTIVYIIAWGAVTTLVDLSKDIEVSSSFVHPNSFHRSNYWVAIASRAVLRGVAAIALVFYGVFWAAAFAPVWLATFQSMFEHGIAGERLIDGLTALVGIALTLHIAAMLLRLALLRAHYGYDT